MTKSAIIPRTFSINIYPAKDAGGYWAECDMPNGGCVTQGDTIKEIQKNMIEAVDFYLEDYPEISDYYLKFEVYNADNTDY